MTNYFHSQDIMSTSIYEGEDEDLYGSSDATLMESWGMSSNPSNLMSYRNFPSLETPNYGMFDNNIMALTTYSDASPRIPKSIIHVMATDELKSNDKILMALSAFTPVNEWRYLLSSSKLFREIKKDYVHFALNHHYSVQYYLNPMTKKMIVDRVSSTQKQISLSLEDRVWIAFDSSVTKTYLERINHVNSCDLSSNPELENISMLTDIQKLNCSNCLKLKELSKLLITNSLLEINLSNCPAFENFEIFSHNKLQVFKISDNPFIQDVSFLAGVSSVTLVNCPNLENVSPLAGNKEVTIKSCEKVTNFSILVDVKILNISRNPQVKFLPAINHERTEKIYFDHCQNLESLNELVENLIAKEKSFNPWTWTADSEDDNSLTSIRSLDIGGYGSMMKSFDLGGFASSVKVISMLGCHNLKDVLCLGKLPSLRKVIFCRCIECLFDTELKRRSNTIKFSVQNCGSIRKRKNSEASNNQKGSFMNKNYFNSRNREYHIQNFMRSPHLNVGYDQSFLHALEDDEMKKFGRNRLPSPDQFYIPDYFRNLSHLN